MRHAIYNFTTRRRLDSSGLDSEPRCVKHDMSGNRTHADNNILKLTDVVHVQRRHAMMLGLLDSQLTTMQHCQQNRQHVFL